jgi:exodeoxyribonuclease-3
LSASISHGINNSKLRKAQPDLKIASYNVNSIRSRLHIVLPWLQNNKPDYFCMQETKVEDAKFPVAEFEELGYQIVFRGNKQYNGVAIAARTKPHKVEFGLDDEPHDSDRLLAAQFDDLAIINAYVPQGQEIDRPQFAYKLAWLGRLKKNLQKHYQKEDKLILCGDFNVAPENIDVYDPKRILGHVSFNPEVWQAYEDMKSWGFTDVFRKHHPAEAGQYTFFDYRVRDSVSRNLGWRVDHILATKPLAAKSRICSIDLASRLAEKPSDHAIIYAQWEGL